MQSEAKSKSKISVIIPTYNRSNRISRAIRSVLAQTFKDFEIIIVDDASNDNTEEIVKAFNDARIKYIRHQKNCGAAASRNTGIKMAKGDFIAFLDDDDEWIPEKLEKQIKIFQENESILGVVYCGYVRIDEETQKIIDDWYPTNKGNVFKAVLSFGWMATPSLLIKKECFEKCGLFDEQLKIAEDGDLLIRIAKVYYFDYVPEVLVKIYDTKKEIYDQAIKSGLILHQRYLNEIEKYPQIHAIFHIWLGAYYCQASDIANAKKHFFKAIKARPLSPRTWVHFLTSLLGSKAYLIITVDLRILKNQIKKYMNIAKFNFKSNNSLMNYQKV